MRLRLFQKWQERCEVARFRVRSDLYKLYERMNYIFSTDLREKCMIKKHRNEMVLEVFSHRSQFEKSLEIK